MENNIDESSSSEVVAYVAGRVEKEIEHFAAAVGLPANAFTTAVAAILQRGSSRQVLRSAESMPNMRGATTARHEERSAEVALDVGPPIDETQRLINASAARMKEGNKVAITDAAKARWLRDYMMGEIQLFAYLVSAGPEEKRRRGRPRRKL